MIKSTKSVSQVTKHFGDLEELIAGLVYKYGPLSTRQIEELVECHNQTGRFGTNTTLRSNIGQVINKLFIDHYLIAFSSISGFWYQINDKQFHKFPQKTFIPVGKKIGYPISINPKEMWLNRYGIGKEYVYVIYSSDVRIEAVLNGFDLFPLKVGKTKNIIRRVEQLSESGPNTLTIGAVLCTDNSTQLEKYLHTKLIDSGQYLDIPGRKEWFRANISQVITHYQQFIKIKNRNQNR